MNISFSTLSHFKHTFIVKIILWQLSWPLEGKFVSDAAQTPSLFPTE